MLDDALYQAILARRSVRRYDNRPLSAAVLAEVETVAHGVSGLVEANRWGVVFRSAGLSQSLGGYGRIVNPPHLLLPYVEGESHALEDLGFRTEQIAVRLAGMGLGSCFIGCLGREEAVRQSFGLPRTARVAAFLIFGRPATSAGGRTVNAVMRFSAGATNKLPAERVFLDGSFRPAAPPPEVAPLIEAARNAPSAVDAQPWRFLWRDGQLHLLVKRHNPRYGPGAGAGYRLHDGGVCMGNVSLALAALGRAGRWILYEDGDERAPNHPAELQPLAQLACSC